MSMRSRCSNISSFVAEYLKIASRLPAAYAPLCQFATNSAYYLNILRERERERERKFASEFA